MFNSLEMVAVSQFGFNHDNPLESRRKASLVFERALRRGKARSFWSRIIGGDNHLRDMGRISQVATPRPAQCMGVVNIPLAKIVGKSCSIDLLIDDIREELRGRIAESAHADDQRARRREALLRVGTQRVEQQVSAVAEELGVVHRGIRVPDVPRATRDRRGRSARRGLRRERPGPR